MTSPHAGIRSTQPSGVTRDRLDSLRGACPYRKTGTHPRSRRGQAFSGTCANLAAHILIDRSPSGQARHMTTGSPAPASPADVLAFWREAGPDKWYRKDDAFDAD